MSAQYVSSTLIRNIIAKNGKSVAVECVDKTTGWIRPTGYPSNSVKEDFAAVASENISAFKAGTATIAMKYAT
ncbi:hypothetical protein LTR75_017753 [Friedmanniomyces endolithicus]|nr:hypothetical protein LTR75_017753 [Friedmanniomyces endolithicus]